MSKFKDKDPFYTREAKKYDKPIPSREFILQYLEERGKPVTFTHILKHFELKEADLKEGIRRRLNAMVKQGQLMTNRRGSFALVDKMELMRGQVMGTKDGRGFVVPDSGGEDILLSPYQMRAVFPDDIVLVRVEYIDVRNQRHGIVVEVLEHNTKQLVGKFCQEDGISFVEPEKKRITQEVLIPPGQENGARISQIVTVEIISQPTHKRRATAKVIEIVGDHMAPGLEIDIAIRAYGLPYQWSDEVIGELKNISKEISEKEIKSRKDFRELMFVTIDGEDAKDFDDAVYCEVNPKGGWKLWVAIADVSYYVKPDAALDREALNRGNSVYFPGRVIPMLPELLSNGLCSLNPNEDRLVIVCQMNISKEGTVMRYLFGEAIIRSQYRLTYDQVFNMFKNEAKKKLQPLQNMLKIMRNLYEVLSARRKERGALEFETTETKIVFDSKGKIKEIVPTYRNDAHRMIEEFMLSANVACAKYLSSQEMPMLYRVHEGLDKLKLRDLIKFLRTLGVKVDFNDATVPTSKQVAKLLSRVITRPDGHIIQTVVLRSMKQAIYSPANKGHFGLAYKYYGHFTSPIRRYPDLLVHRAIKHLNSGGNRDNFIYDFNEMSQYGEHCSMTERRADDATRDAVAWLKCEFIQGKLGQIFDGIISNVTGFGIFVELKDIYVEGLVHITNLDNDYYQFDSSRYCLTGRRTGKKYKLGDKIKIKVAKVNLDDKLIDFELY